MLAVVSSSASVACIKSHLQKERMRQGNLEGAERAVPHQAAVFLNVSFVGPGSGAEESTKIMPLYPPQKRP